ncbi:MAG: potassium channel protein [Salinivirgaceae bacterium]|nr:potassium channel protein [Salinivirgaceae bacterium]
MTKNFSSLSISAAMLITIVLVGAVGFMAIEDYSLLDAFFMTMITVSTVGFGEIQPLTPLGKVFTTFMIVFSFGAFAYAVTSITRFIVDGGFRNYFVNKRTSRKITHLNNHVIICGYGRNGSEAARVFYEKKQAFVIIEETPEIVDEIRHRTKMLYVEGDSTDDNILRMAGIESAKSLITTLPNDADNLLVILSARAINKKLQIISRASNEWSDVKFKRAGADNVIMPDLVGGRRMAKLVAKPDVVSFLDYMLKKQPGEVQLVELNCEDFACTFLSKSIGELNFRKISGVNIVGLKDHEGKYIFNPPPEFKLTSEYKLFVMGKQEQLAKLRAAVYENM